MRTSLTQRGPDDAGRMSPQGTALLARARALHLAAHRGPLGTLLAGKNVGLLCDAQGDVDADAIEAAAAALGAHVAHVRPNFASHGHAGDLQQAARLLGRLYDVLACVGLSAAQVQSLRETAGIPVLDVLAAPSATSARLVELLDLALPAEGKRTLIIQAALLNALA